MRQLVESLKRLYERGKVTKGKLAQMVKENKITQEEFNFIING